MKILLFGKNGQVGWELQRSLAPLGELVALDFDSRGPLAADFSNPDQPVLDSSYAIAQSGWSAAARFDGNRLYLSPESGYYDGSDTTPFQVFTPEPGGGGETKRTPTDTTSHCLKVDWPAPLTVPLR